MLKSCLKKESQPSKEEEISSSSSSSSSSSYIPPPFYSPSSSPLSQSSNGSSNWDKRKRKICFGRIEIYEHAYILGDNPSVSDGAPLSISWKCHKKSIYEVEYYEAYHHLDDDHRQRQRDSSRKLSVTRRAEILLTAGYSMVDLMERTLEVAKDKALRQDSIRNRKWDAIHATIEKTTRKIRKAARRSSLLNSGSSSSSSSSSSTTNKSWEESTTTTMPDGSGSGSSSADQQQQLQSWSPRSVIAKVNQVVLDSNNPQEGAEGNAKQHQHHHHHHRDIEFLAPRIDSAKTA